MSGDVLNYPIPAPAALVAPPEWATLRRECPVAPVRLASGDAATLLTRYQDVRQVLSDPRFSRQLDAGDAARLADTDSVLEREDSRARGEPHQRWRRLVGRWFTAKRMNALRPRVEARAEELVDDLVAQGPPADLAAHVGFPLPAWVICEILGVPHGERERFAYWSDTLLNLTKYTQAEIDQAQGEFAEYFSAHIAAKRAAPGDDLLSELITVTDDGDGQLTEEELLLTGMTLLVAGHETTASMIGKMVAMLLADRRHWELLLADPSLVRPAVEEALRFDADPGFGMPRYISEELDVAGTRLPRGTTVVCCTAAANRDEDAFARAGELDLTRSPNPHVAFGVGPHSCLGQSLARTELQVALAVLLRRLPALELAVPVAELRSRQGLLVGGLESLPVRW